MTSGQTYELCFMRLGRGKEPPPLKICGFSSVQRQSCRCLIEIKGLRFLDNLLWAFMRLPYLWHGKGLHNDDVVLHQKDHNAFKEHEATWM